MKKLLTNNLGWKLLSVLLSIILWLVVINNEDPYITKEFSNVPVVTINEGVITSKEKAVEIVSGDKITIKVRGKRKEVDTLKLSDITAVADLRYVSFWDAVTIDVTTNKPSIEIIKKSQDSIIVKVEDIKYGQLKINYNLIGTPETKYVVDSVKISPNSVQISGPETQFNLVKNIIVDVNVEGTTENVILTAIPRIVDEKGNEVAKITSNINEIQVEAVIYRKKTVPVTINTTGTVSSGYKLTSFKYSPDNITIYGKESDIAAISSINLGEFDISDIVGEFRETIYINQFLPSNIKFNNDDKEVEVIVTVEKLEEQTIQIPIDNITVTNYPANTQFRFVSTEPISLTVRGLKADIDVFLASSMLAKVSLADLEIGKHNVLVDLVIPSELAFIGEVPQVEIELSGVNNEEIGD
ncbi:MAG: uncharacterized protein K0R15_1228 [Clostridiales bacterium]|jgi:YbbR domain-containing protein|nr:uncharacterized protein [Clostridiales bacterium]